MLLKKHMVIILGLTFILIAFILVSLLLNEKKLEAQLVKANEETAKVNEEIVKIHAYLKELEQSDDLDKAEFISTWKSLAIIRKNFIALGVGGHLEDKDICPEEELGVEDEEDYFNEEG